MILMTNSGMLILYCAFIFFLAVISVSDTNNLINSELIKQGFLIVKGSGINYFWVTSGGFRRIVSMHEMAESVIEKIVVQTWPDEQLLKMPLGSPASFKEIISTVGQSLPYKFDLIEKSSSETFRPYIIIGNNGGLGNRLRVLAAFIVVAKEILKVPAIIMVWHKNRDCAAHFFELYEPIENVVFIPRGVRQYLTSNAKRVYGYEKYFEDIISDHGLNVSKQIDYEDSSYKYFIPVPKILNTATKFSRSNNIQDAIALHIRRTDFVGVVKVNRTDQDFFNIIDSYDQQQRVFVLTDNPLTRKLFKSRYGSRIIFFGHIPNMTQPNSLRYTSLQFSLIEAIIASTAKAFYGTPRSSWSRYVEILWRNRH